MNQIVSSLVYIFHQVNSSWILFFNRTSNFLSSLFSQMQQKNLMIHNLWQSQAILSHFLHNAFPSLHWFIILHLRSKKEH